MIVLFLLPMKVTRVISGDSKSPAPTVRNDERQTGPDKQWAEQIV